jgi:hypothetical protein
MVVFQSINLALRFVLELFALGAVGYWGFQVGKDGPLRWLMALGAPALLAIIWAVFGSPKAVVKLSMPLHFFVEVLTFGLPALALYLVGKQQIAIIYIILVIINRGLMFVWNQ